MAICELEGVVKRYREVTALNSFDLEVKEGEILGLLGPNGSGKTTAISCLLGLLTYDQGRISLYGEAPGSLDPCLRRRIGLVPSDLAYFEDLPVIDNIRYFAGLYEPDRRTHRKMADEALELTGLAGYRKLAARKLSGGLKRRLNIACGLVHRPEFLVMDEPTLALDAQSRTYVLDQVLELNRAGTTILYTTHYLEEAQDLCDRIVIIDQGRNLASGTLNELIALTDAVEQVHLDLAEAETESAVRLLRSLDGVEAVEAEGGRLTVRLSHPGRYLADLVTALHQQEIRYTTLYSELPTLNDVFLSLTGRALRD